LASRMKTLAELRKMRTEYDTQLQKNKILTGEFHSLEAKFTKSQAQYEATIDSLREQLKTYEHLEYELDVAIVASGERGLKESVDNDISEFEPPQRDRPNRDSIVSALGATLPTSSKRRIQQSILLAQKLVDKQRQLDQLKEQLLKEQNSKQELALQFAAAQKQLDRVKQPYNYLIEQLERKEFELQQSQLMCKQLQQQLQVISAEYQKGLDVQRKLQADIQKLLQHRKDMQSLQSMVTQLHARSRSGTPVATLAASLSGTASSTGITPGAAAGVMPRTSFSLPASASGSPRSARIELSAPLVLPTQSTFSDPFAASSVASSSTVVADLSSVPSQPAANFILHPASTVVPAASSSNTRDHGEPPTWISKLASSSGSAGST